MHLNLLANIRGRHTIIIYIIYSLHPPNPSLGIIMYRPPPHAIIAADARRLLLFGRWTKRPTVDECRLRRSSRRRRRCCCQSTHHRMVLPANSVASSSYEYDYDYDVGGGGWPHRRSLSSSSASASPSASASDPPTPYSKPRNVELWEELASKELSRSGMTVESLRSDRVTPVSQGERERERERFLLRHNIIIGTLLLFLLIHISYFVSFFLPLYIICALLQLSHRRGSPSSPFTTISTIPIRICQLSRQHRFVLFVIAHFLFPLAQYYYIHQPLHGPRPLIASFLRARRVFMNVCHSHSESSIFHPPPPPPRTLSLHKT